MTQTIVPCKTCHSYPCVCVDNQFHADMDWYYHNAPFWSTRCWEYFVSEYALYAPIPNWIVVAFNRYTPNDNKWRGL